MGSRDGEVGHCSVQSSGDVTPSLEAPCHASAAFSATLHQYSRLQLGLAQLQTCDLSLIQSKPFPFREVDAQSEVVKPDVPRNSAAAGPEAGPALES